MGLGSISGEGDIRPGCCMINMTLRDRQRYVKNSAEMTRFKGNRSEYSCPIDTVWVARWNSKSWLDLEDLVIPIKEFLGFVLQILGNLVPLFKV